MEKELLNNLHTLTSPFCAASARSLSSKPPHNESDPLHAADSTTVALGVAPFQSNFLSLSSLSLTVARYN